ncbi:MAG: glycosyltransferase family 4 protein [Planctomycetes bacterium]|nr:glycosyltransferase family 4 protein [Planctomycetota bacterium]
MGRKLRILRVVTRLNVGGPSRHIRLLMEGLDPERFEQRLVTGSLAEGEIELAEATPWVRDRLPEMQRRIAPWRDLRAARRLRAIIADFRPDLIHSHQAKAGALARCVGHGRARLVHTFHGNTFSGYWGPVRGRILRAVERRLARRSDALVVQAPSQAEDVLRFLGQDLRPRLRLVAPSVDFAALEASGGAVSMLRSELEIGPARVLAFVGRLAPVKNCAAFIRVFARLKAMSRHRLVALIVGGGDRAEEGRLQDLVDRLGVRADLRWLGYRRDVADVYRLADVLVSTSINEGTPLGLLEGAWCGAPIAAFGVGGIPDLLQGLGGTRIVEPGLEEPLALAIDELLGEGRIEGPALVGMRAELERRHGPARLVADLADLYRELGG